MAYVAVKGGERAIDNAHAWLAEDRRGDPAVPELSLAQIREQLGRSVDRVMAEGSLYDPHLAALAIKQAQGDLIATSLISMIDGFWLQFMINPHAATRNRAIGNCLSFLRLTFPHLSNVWESESKSVAQKFARKKA